MPKYSHILNHLLQPPHAPLNKYKYAGSCDIVEGNADTNDNDDHQLGFVTVTVLFEPYITIKIQSPYLNGFVVSTNIATITGTKTYENVELGVNITASYNTKTNVYTIQIGNNNAVTITILNNKYTLDGFYYNSLSGTKIEGNLVLVETMLTSNKELIIYPKLVKKSYNVTLG